MCILFLNICSVLIKKVMQNIPYNLIYSIYPRHSWADMKLVSVGFLVLRMVKVYSNTQAQSSVLVDISYS